MDLLALLRTLGGLGLVLGLLAGALWAVRRYDLKLPGRVSATRRKRVELVERLAIDAKRSVALIRRDGCEHLILIGPDGDVVIETAIAAPVAPEAVLPEPKRLAGAFARLVESAPDTLPAMRRREPRQSGHRPRWNRAAVRDALRG
jgi:hypothetical protein